MFWQGILMIPGSGKMMSLSALRCDCDKSCRQNVIPGWEQLNSLSAILVPVINQTDSQHWTGILSDFCFIAVLSKN